MSAKSQKEHLKFTNDLRFLGIPEYLVRKAINRDPEDAPVYFLLRLSQNKGTVLILEPTMTPKKGTKPYKGWKSNKESRRYYIATATLLSHLRVNHHALTGRSFPTTIQDNTIRAVLPVSVR